MQQEHTRKKLHHRFYSIRTSMVLCFMLLISVVVLLVSVLSYNYAIRDYEKISIHYTESLLAEVNGNIDSYIDNVKSMSSIICSNPDVQDLMAEYNRYRGFGVPRQARNSIETLRARAAQQLGLMADTRSEITNIAVISKYRDVLLSDPRKQVNPYSEYNLTDWFLKPLSLKEEIVVSPSHVQNLVKDEYTWVISVSRAVIDRMTGEVTGVMVIDLNFLAIEGICETAQLGKNGYIYIIDRNQNIIYHPQQQLIYSGIKVDPLKDILVMRDSYLRTAENKIYTKSESELTGWTVVGVINASELISDRTAVVNFYFTLSAACLLAATLAALLISTTITRPLQELEETMHKVEEGDWAVRASTATNNEIGQIGKTFNTMISRMRELRDGALANEEAKRKSEINALQAQINPHFLYNTLDTIIWMSASGKTEEVTEVTAALAKLFRTSISKGENYVSLANELENIRSYLTIQQMRYGEQLSYAIDVPRELLTCTVPKLILQPIVENALYHGVKLSETAGTITIGGAIQGKRLLLTVCDDGVGMTAAQLETLFDSRENGERGIGVTNVNHRIQLCYGEAYGLCYFSAPGEGTRVEITLPVHREEKP